MINVKVSGKKSAEMIKKISDLLLDTTEKILKKKKDLIAIAIEFVEHDTWLVGGVSLSEQNKNSFYFDITVTDETNTKDEKALYIKENFAGFEKILGELHPVSYIYIIDARAATYGYQGKTQEYRYHVK